MRPITQEKMDHITNFMQKKNIDAIVIADWETTRDVNMRYLSGHPMDATLVVSSSGETCLIPWDLQLAEDYAQVDVILDFKEFPTRYYDAAVHYIKNMLKKDAPIIGVNQYITYNYIFEIKERLPLAKFYDNSKEIYNLFNELRATKSNQELENLSLAGKIGSRAIKDIRKFAEEKIGTENDLSFLVMKKLREYGADDNSFPSLIANTTRSHMIHCHPSAGNNKFAKNGLALIDYGALCNGYCCDITIPFAFGKITKEQEKIRNTTLHAYKEAISSIDLGVPLWKISKAANDIIENAGYKMPHSLGHGLGLTVHDSPLIRQKPTEPIELKDWKEIVVEDGMVFTIEPGVYVKGMGGQRLENNVMIKDGQVLVFTKSEMFEIE